MKSQQTATPTKSLSAAARALAEAFERDATHPFLASPYNDLPSDDCLILVNGISFYGGDWLNKPAQELGWVTQVDNGTSWRWSAAWLKELKKKGRLGRFYGFVKVCNFQVRERQAAKAA